MCSTFNTKSNNGRTWSFDTRFSTLDYEKKMFTEFVNNADKMQSELKYFYEFFSFANEDYPLSTLYSDPICIAFMPSCPKTGVPLSVKRTQSPFHVLCIPKKSDTFSPSEIKNAVHLRPCDIGLLKHMQRVICICIRNLLRGTVPHGQEMFSSAYERWGVHKFCWDEQKKHIGSMYLRGLSKEQIVYHMQRSNIHTSFHCSPLHSVDYLHMHGYIANTPTKCMHLMRKYKNISVQSIISFLENIKTTNCVK